MWSQLNESNITFRLRKGSKKEIPAADKLPIDKAVGKIRTEYIVYGVAVIAQALAQGMMHGFDSITWGFIPKCIAYAFLVAVVAKETYVKAIGNVEARKAMMVAQKVEDNPDSICDSDRLIQHGAPSSPYWEGFMCVMQEQAPGESRGLLVLSDDLHSNDLYIVVFFFKMLMFHQKESQPTSIFFYLIK